MVCKLVTPPKELSLISLYIDLFTINGILLLQQLPKNIFNANPEIVRHSLTCTLYSLQIYVLNLFNTWYNEIKSDFKSFRVSSLVLQFLDKFSYSSKLIFSKYLRGGVDPL